MKQRMSRAREAGTMSDSPQLRAAAQILKRKGTRWQRPAENRSPVWSLIVDRSPTIGWMDMGHFDGRVTFIAFKNGHVECEKWNKRQESIRSYTCWYVCLVKCLLVNWDLNFNIFRWKIEKKKKPPKTESEWMAWAIRPILEKCQFTSCNLSVSQTCLPLVSSSSPLAFLFLCLVTMSFVSITETCLSYKCTQNVHDSFCTFWLLFFCALLVVVFGFRFDHLSIQEESKQFVYEMCKWDMQRCDRDGIMEKTLIRLCIVRSACLPACPYSLSVGSQLSAERVLFEAGKRILF